MSAENVGLEPSDSYVYVDDEGNAIPPEEETSWLMAMGVRGHDSEKPVDDSAAKSSEKQYTEDPVKFEQERVLATDRLEAALTKAGTGKKPKAKDVPAVDGEDEVYAFSREVTEDVGSWTLERIIDRRVIRGTKGGSDYKVFYDDFGNKETGMLADGRMEYLCKWKWYVEPTWETRDLLEDEGYLREMRAFDDEALKDKTASLSQMDDVKVTEVAVKEPAEVAVEEELMVERIFGDDAPVVALAGIDDNVLCSLFEYSGVKPTVYGCCAKQNAINAFIKKSQRLSKTHRPVILFHGTQQTNLYNIAMNGLRVPRESSEVKNGPGPCGKGIYASALPNKPVYYCGTTGFCGALFLCVGLVSNNDPNVITLENYCDVPDDYCVVFKDSSLILPIWQVNFAKECHDHPKRRIITPENMILPPDTSGMFKQPSVKKTSPAKAKAMTKVKNKNITHMKKTEKDNNNGA